MTVHERNGTVRTEVAIVGGGVVGAAILHELSHRGVDAVLLEREADLAYGASGTNSGVLHTGFDSTPGELETELILRAARRRGRVLEALGVPVLPCGAELVPRSDAERETVRELARNAAANGVAHEIRAGDGALLVPGESVTDPVALTIALAASAVVAGGAVLRSAEVVGIEPRADDLELRTSDGRPLRSRIVVNAAGLLADRVARLVGDDSFEIYPRKGEFLVFELPGGRTLDRILLPVPTKRTKGVLVFPTLDGRVVAGPTAVDLVDKDDWSVRPEAVEEILGKAVAQFPALAGLTPIASYAGLRPAGRDTNYRIGRSPACAALINVAAIRSTGLSAGLGIAEYVAELIAAEGIEVGEPRDPEPAPRVEPSEWWRRTARLRASGAAT